MDGQLLTDRGWPGLLAGLPEELNVAELAQARGAFRRPRGVRSAEALPRLALVHANTPLSSRGTAARAAAAGVAEVSDVALPYRLRQAEAWLGSIPAALLGEVVRAPAAVVPPVQVVDATSSGWPGATGRAAAPCVTRPAGG